MLALIGLSILFHPIDLQGADPPPNPSQDFTFFETKIRPVLIEHCYGCHATDAKKIRGDLLLDTRAGIRKGGDTGPAVVPGNPADSLLLKALRQEDLEMPPKGKLPDAIIADFETWIQNGAPDPRDSVVGPAPEKKTIDVEAAKSFWAFQPPQRTTAPSVQDAYWPKNEIDHYVLAGLEKNELHPVADADPLTLVRRVYFDLTGLPPTPRQVDEFIQDESPNRLGVLIDRLLASPHFGERWGRHWLDVARYAESSGGGRSVLFQNAWRYRDYVIDAFNSDKPLDRFVTEQIAGDLLPERSRIQRGTNLVATGFLALGPKNLDNQDKELLRMDTVDEQIDTIGRTFLGMTVGCARCHDHKFDPIPTTDYYALAGIFRSTKTLLPGNVSGFVEQPIPIDAAHETALALHAETLKPLQDNIAKNKNEVKKLRSALTKLVSLENLPGIIIDDAKAVRRGNWIDSRYSPIYVGEGYIHDDNKDKGKKSLTFNPSLPAAGEYEVRLAYTSGTNRADNVPVTIQHTEGRTTVHVDQRKTPPIHGLFKSIGRFRFDKGQSAAVIVSNDKTANHVIADAVQFLPMNTIAAAASAKPDAQLGERSNQIKAQLDIQEADLKKMEREFQAREETAPPPRPLAMSVQDEEDVADYHVCVRGNVHSPGQPVPRGFLTVAGFSDASSITPKQSGRRELARWLTRPDHPLTARVFVNRVWHHLIGHGIVRTPDNFGMTGERPTHPELLDHLAIRFIENDWSVKQLIRHVMQSRTYQLSTAHDPAAQKADPENRLIWRMNARPLQAETLRDAVLATADTLDLTPGGQTIRPSTESEFGYVFQTKRRSVYVPIFRNTLPELFEVFDFADPNLVIGRRSRSTLPTQALYQMNSPFIMNQARQAALALLAVDNLDQNERITLAYRRTLGRPPTDQERRLAEQHLAASISNEPENNPDSNVEPWADLFHALFACIDFRYLN